MKKTLQLFAFIFCFNASHAQLIATYNSEALLQLPSQTLNVMLIGKNPYDDAIKEAISNFWKVSSFEFKTKEEIEKLMSLNDKTTSFLVPLEISEINDGSALINFALPIRGLDDTKWLCIFNGGITKKVINLKPFNLALQAPFDNFSYEQELNLASYRLGLIIKNFNDYVGLVNEGKIASVKNQSVEKSQVTVFNYMNTKAPVLKEKTLLINEDLVKNKNEKGKTAIDENILKSYSFKYKVVPITEIETAIKSKNKDFAYLCPVFNTHKYIVVYDLEQGDIIYCAYEYKGLTLSSKDITTLQSVVNK